MERRCEPGPGAERTGAGWGQAGQGDRLGMRGRPESGGKGARGSVCAVASVCVRCPDGYEDLLTGIVGLAFLFWGGGVFFFPHEVSGNFVLGVL